MIHILLAWNDNSFARQKRWNFCAWVVFTSNEFSNFDIRIVIMANLRRLARDTLRATSTFADNLSV